MTSALQAPGERCLSEETIARFVDGLLRAEELALAEAHIAGCESCRWVLSATGRAADEDTQPAGSQVVTAPLGALRETADGARDPLVGALLKQTYRVEALVGSGGMGSVYQAKHVELPRRFAVKVLAFDVDPRSEEGAVAAARLRREAEVTSALTHPHIVETVDFGALDDGRPFIVMELLSGEDLASRLRREGSIRQVSHLAAIVRQTADALAAAHAEGVVHRDLKPTNVFLCARPHDALPFSVKLLDFGISKVSGATSELTQYGSLVGTPGYMSPEQAQGAAGAADHRSDVFSLGVLAYRMLTGRSPFAAATVPTVLYNIVHVDPPPPSALCAGAPRALDRVVQRALQKEPHARYDSAAAFADDFGAALDRASGETLVPATTREMLAPPPEPKRGRLALVAAGIALPAVIALAVVLGSGPGEQRQGASGTGQPTGSSAPMAAPLHDAAAAAAAAAARPDAAAAATASRPDVVKLRTVATRTRAPGSSGGSGSSRGSSSTRSPRRSPRTRAPIRVRVVPTPRRSSEARGTASLLVQTRLADGRHIWAAVVLDGKAVGFTALKLARLAPGRHEIVVRRKGYRAVRRTVRLRAGTHRILRLTLLRR